MDVYDPQTLGFMVFGGFMVVSAIGIALVSTLSMKETSYEEALAKQRRDLSKSTQPQLSGKNKKKPKSFDNKSKGKKKEEQPNGKLSNPELFEEPVESASEPEPVPVATPEPEPEPIVAAPEPVMVACAAPALVAVEAPATTHSPKEKKKKKVAKVAPAPVVAAAVSETAIKEVPIMVVPPVAPITATPAPELKHAPAMTVAKAEEPKTEVPTKKKKSKAKAEPVATEDSADAPLLLPYKSLLSTVTSMTFSERETQKLIQVLSDKAGLDSWQLASQKGDPMAALRKQLEEKEKQLSTEQEVATNAKNRLREVTKELSAEKSKMASVETRLSSELSARAQEITALQARMQASYQDHVAETQQLNLKLANLQEQLDNGPVAQLARLQQENSILRDALNQATSQAESRQNAELAKLRQDCVRLNRELGERAEALQADEECRKALETKVAAAEEKLTKFQAVQVESERAMQKKLNEASQKLQKSQDTSKLMKAQLDKAQEKAATFDKVQERMDIMEVQLKERCAELEALKAQQAVMSAAKEEAILLEAAVKTTTEEQQTKLQADNYAEMEALKSCLITKEVQVVDLEEKLQQLNVELELLKSAQAIEEPRLNGVKDEEERSTVKEQPVQKDDTAEIQLLQNSLKEKEDIMKSLEEQLHTLRAEMELKCTDAARSIADVEQLESKLKERESLVALLEEQLKQRKEEMEQMKSTSADSGSETDAEQPFENLEKDSQMLSLEEELQQLKEEMEQVKNKSNDIREKNWAAMEALTAAEKLNEENLAESKREQRIAEEALKLFQTDAQKALQMYCPDVSLEQNNWLEQLIEKAKSQGDKQTTDSEEHLSKLREAEESQKTLQMECEQYRTVLAETEGMLKDLQKSVEEEELVWKCKITEAEEQRQAALDEVKMLKQAAEQMKLENENTDQLKAQVMLLEAQLEKQLESISFSQTCAEEVTQMKALLTKTQVQLEAAHSEAQRQAEELSVVRQQLSDATERVQRKEVTESTQVQNELEQTTNKLQTEEELRQQLAIDFDQAQKCVTDLQTQMDQMKALDNSSTGELMERLEKERKLTRDLGLAATKLQQMLKATQEQLAKERDTVKTLQDQVVDKEEPEQLKEGTSV
ncbi:hypothetical protein UPYG_G00069190 [Umbra pygmaea]|uniref:Ribosome receptor lysine/proline rich domain-containing protein n=1 Tax=Umbra pygmaea TaxID=75934 RepID=A0ABD0XB54_UMBPY